MNILQPFIRTVREYPSVIEKFEAVNGQRRRFTAVSSRRSVISGLCDGAEAAFLAAFLEDIKRVRTVPALMIVPDEKAARRLFDTLTEYSLDCLVCPSRDFVFYNVVSSREYDTARIMALSAVIENSKDAIICTPDAAMQYTMPRDLLDRSLFHIGAGEQMSVDELSGILVSNGYSRVDTVDGRGQFALRGGIFDVFSPAMEAPVRLEFFGDEIDSVFFFDVISQRRREKAEEAVIVPAREVIVRESDRPKLERKIEELAEKAPADSRKTLQHELETVKNGFELHNADKYINVLYEKQSLLDYYGADDVFAVFTFGGNGIDDRIKSAEFTLFENVSQLITNSLISGRDAEYSATRDDFEEFLEKRGAFRLESLGYPSGEAFSFKSRAVPNYGGNPDLLRDDVLAFRRAGMKTAISADNVIAMNNVRELLAENGVPSVIYERGADIDPSAFAAGVPVIFISSLTEGFELPTVKFVFLSLSKPPVSGARKGGARLAGKVKVKQSSKEKIMSYADLTPGDYVVHSVHGIGVYEGIENFKNYAGIRRDHIKLRYAGDDIIYLPCENIENISKYIGAHSDDGTLKLSSIGGSEWNRTKTRVKAAAKDMAKELIALYAERMRRRGFAFPADDDYQRQFESVFEYEETEAQLQAADEIKRDMERPVPMDRLLCGDVGFGKTEVALRAAFKAVESGKQVAVLVPTTILCMQHYLTISARMRDFPVKVAQLSRFSNSKEQAATLRALRRGEIDIVVGTHRLLSDDVAFRDLGLLIIDEEQRFGVAHKEKLKKLSTDVDVLTLTATPIPRTLNMAMSEIRDMSILDEAPGDRQPVQTYVLEYDEVILFDAVRRELARGGQVFWLHNNTETINTRAARIAQEFPDAAVAVAHGQMDKGILSDVWQGLVDGHTDILVCTTIIETGVDVPNANTLIIERADRMGLSQLHQIRGRTGRSARKAYAYFTYPSGRALTEIAEKRLTAIRDYTEFGSGFKIALRDLELRGAGDVLGAKQHGHIESVGYDMYIKILNEAVLEETGKTVEPKTECTVDIKLDSYLPREYISSDAHRVDIYKKIAAIENAEDLDDVAAELLDRYGDLPPSVETLMRISLCRALGSTAGISRIEEREGSVYIYPEKFDAETVIRFASEQGNIVIMPSKTPTLRCRPPKNVPLLGYLVDLLTKYIQLKEEKV